MNFFAQQDQARKQTRRMLVLFALAVIVIVLVVDVVLLLTYDTHNLSTVIERGRAGFYEVVQLKALGVSSLVVLGIIALASCYRISGLAGGGGALAQQLGAIFVPPDTKDFVYRRLRNIVEEMAIAAGLPVPDVFVLENETGINAFVSGYTPADAAITVTRGCLNKLTRDELQGVIAHEFSHILNGDMRLNLRLIGLVFGILVIATFGRKLTGTIGNNRGRLVTGAVLLGLVFWIVGYIGVLFGRLIKASISRSREYLADASAVQFTRQASGIAGALKKIGGLDEGSVLALDNREEVSHMLFGDGIGYARLFATHPPLNDRIKRLDPAFQPREFDKIAMAWSEPVFVGELQGGEDHVGLAQGNADTSIAGFAPAEGRLPVRPGIGVVLPKITEGNAISTEQVIRQVGNPGNGDIRTAGLIHASISEMLLAAAYAMDRSVALIFALVLHTQEEVGEQQLAMIEHHYDVSTRADVESLVGEMTSLHPLQRLPLAALAFPTLRRRPRAQLQLFILVLKQLIQGDGQVSLDEYCLAKLINVQVIQALNPAAASRIGRVRLVDVANDLAELFALVARYGHEDAEQAARAFALGMHEALPNATFNYAPPHDWQPVLDRLLPRLDLLAPAGKELIVRGLIQTISANNYVNVAEAELLRTICASIHCPLPPLFQQI